MDPMVARAFLAIHLSPAGREKFRNLERAMIARQPLRHLMPFEICSLMKEKPKNPTDQEIARMESLWRDYERHNTQQSWAFDDPETIGKAPIDAVYSWEDHAIESYMRWIDIPISVSPVSDAELVVRRPRADLE